MSSNKNFARWVNIDESPYIESARSTTSYHTVEIPEIRRISDLDIRQSFDVLNKRTIELESKLTTALKLIDELRARNVGQDEMIEYLKDVANKEI